MFGLEQASWIEAWLPVEEKKWNVIGPCRSCVGDVILVFSRVIKVSVI